MLDKKVNVVVSSSNEYVPYLSVFLQSLKDNLNVDRLYSIYVLERNISLHNKYIIQQQIECKNIKLEFINVSNSMADFSVLCNGKHFSVDTFSRFYIPELLTDCDKCVYCDIDTIVCADLAELFDTNIDNYAAAVCRDSSMTSMYYDNVKFWEPYFDGILKIKDPRDYFQGGVLVLNLKYLRDINAFEALCKLAETKGLKLADQCIFNIYLKGKVKYLDQAWNYVIENFNMRCNDSVSLMPLDIRQEYLKAKHAPKIIHYAGDRKPWIYVDEEFASIWWEYAKKTPFFDKIIELKSVRVAEENELNQKQKFRNFIKFLFYVFCLFFIFGNARRKCRSKKLTYKQKLELLP